MLAKMLAYNKAFTEKKKQPKSKNFTHISSYYKGKQ